MTNEPNGHIIMAQRVKYHKMPIWLIFNVLIKKILHTKHQNHLRAIVSIGYPPRVTIYEVSSVQIEDFVHKCGFCDFDPPWTIII